MLGNFQYVIARIKMENACLNLKIIIFLKFIACIYNIAYFLNKISIHIFAKMIFKWYLIVHTTFVTKISINYAIGELYKKKNNFKYNILENFSFRHCHKLCKPFLRAISPLHYPLLYTPNVSEDSMIFQENKTLENTYRCVFPCGVNILFKSRDEWSLTSLETLRIPGSGPNNFAGYFSGYSVLEKHIYIYKYIYEYLEKEGRFLENRSLRARIQMLIHESY